MRGRVLALLAVAVAGSSPLHAWRSDTVRANVWRPSAADFVFPERWEGTALAEHLARRDDFGIALAGGGERGFSVAHGAVRSMRKAGIMSKARYFSTTSGSVWLSVPMYYQTQDTLDSFLGESLPPEKLTPEVLTGSSAGKAISRLWLFPRYPRGLAVNSSLLESSQEEAFPDLPRELVDIQHRVKKCIGSFNDLCSCLVDIALPHMQESWAIVTGFAFLHPFGIAGRDAFHCHESEVESLRAQVGGRREIYAARDISQGLPFPIMQSSILPPIEATRDANTTTTAFPTEQTPLYSGTPVAYAGARAAPYAAIGDAYVSSFAWPGQALDPVPANASSQLRVRRQVDWLNLGQLAQATGVATSYISDFQGLPSTSQAGACDIALAKKLLPAAELWSPLDADEHGVPRAQTSAVGDAGIYDDLGHIPLLRRGVSKLVIYDSSAIHENTTGRDEPNLCELTYLRAAFGQPGCLPARSAPGAPLPRMPEGFSTVFEASEFAPLWAHIKASRAAGEPAVYRSRFTVVDNEFLGIKGGRQVDVVWVILLPSAKWRSALPARTASVVKDWFPNFGCAELKSRMVFSLASQFASWVTEELVSKEVQAMLSDSEPRGSIVI